MPASIFAAFGRKDNRMAPVLETRRMQPMRIKALAAFQAATCWVYGCLVGADSVDQHLQVISRGDMDPGVRDQVDEAVVACVRSLDPIAETAARHQARTAALERLDVVL